MSAETNPLAILKGAARANFTRALGIAQSSESLPDEWIRRATQIGAARNRTYTPVIGTILLAKATNPNVSAFALKTGGVTRGYSPRSLAKDVLVPLCTESNIDIRTHGAEPFNNQSFFAKNEIRREMVPANSLDRPDLDYLVDSVERADRLSSEQALLALAAYLRVRLTMSSRAVVDPATPAGFTQRGLEHAAAAFVGSSSDAGRRGKALMAACLDLAFPNRVLDPGKLPATRSLGDIAVSAASPPGDQSDIILVAVVKARPVSASEMLQLAERITQRDIGKALLLALSPRQSGFDLTEGAIKAADRYQVNLEFSTDLRALVKAAILWSPYPLQECLSRLPTLVSQRLSHFRCDNSDHEQWRNSLDTVTGPWPEQAPLPLFGA